LAYQEIVQDAGRSLVVWLGIRVEYHSLLPELARLVPTIAQTNRKTYWAGHPYKGRQGMCLLYSCTRGTFGKGCSGWWRWCRVWEKGNSLSCK